MRYDDDRYLDDEEDNDLWDDELNLSSDDSRPMDAGIHRPTYAQESSYSPYNAEEDNDHNADTGEYGNENTDRRSGANTDEEDNDYYSDPEPSEPKKTRREGFFSRKKAKEEDEDEDEEGNDYYDSVAEPTPRVKKPKAPRLDPEDPDYWIKEEESPLSGIMPPPVKKWKWMLGVALVLIAGIIFAWIWFLRPHTDNAVKYGYIKHMERRGSIIKTFEGSMIPYKELGDPNPFYFEELRFSVQSDSLAAVMKRMMLGCVPVRVEYEIYHSPLPWKGDERMIIIKADTADPRKILPPEYR